MIEEPDWDGRVERYGSVPPLVDELTAGWRQLDLPAEDIVDAGQTAILLGIADADPSVEQSAEPEAQECSLAATSQALDLNYLFIFLFY